MKFPGSAIRNHATCRPVLRKGPWDGQGCGPSRWRERPMRLGDAAGPVTGCNGPTRRSEQGRQKQSGIPRDIRVTILRQAPRRESRAQKVQARRTSLKHEKENTNNPVPPPHKGQHKIREGPGRKQELRTS
ncbi:hypothetical protein E2C01_092613 [Portunus trituberculatus]|uniref:Uncharacterized protein n=1 Tax=Portunus trituberculatus TaxID=210409 RepID=A0A5B7JY81_PORTR|nr:hypothetical protein [Portunus trituberculatus]